MPKRKSGPNSELMLQAGATGGQAAARGQEAVLREREQAANATQEGFQRAGGALVEVGEREKDRELQREKFAEDKRQYEDQKQIKLADKGLVEEGAGPGAAPPGGAEDPRAQELQKEMERGKEQMSKPMEAATQGKPRYVHSEERQAKEKSELETRQYNAETARANAYNAERRRVDAYNEAQQKQDTEALKQVRQQMQAPMEADQKLRDDLGTGKLGPDDGRWKSLEEMIDDPLTGQHPSQELVDEVRSKTNGPNLARFISNRQAMAGIRMAGDTGDLPDAKLIDTTNPLWQQFFAATKQAEGFLGGSAIGQFVDVKSVQHKNRLCHQAAALIMQLQPLMGAQSPPQPGAQPAQGGGGGSVQQQPNGTAAPSGPQQQPAPAPPQRSAEQQRQQQNQRVLTYGLSGGGPR